MAGVQVNPFTCGYLYLAQIGYGYHVLAVSQSILDHFRSSLLVFIQNLWVKSTDFICILGEYRYGLKNLYPQITPAIAY